MTNVFISSTSKDLIEYRKAAIDTCLSLDLFPIAMENFSAMGVGATEGSKRKLDQADLYVGIFAYRYGYVEGSSTQSVTEIEFDYAGERKLERLCFLVDDKYAWPHADDDEKPEYQQKLREFKARINMSLIRGQFTTVDNFQKQLILALVEWQRNNPTNISNQVTFTLDLSRPEFDVDKFIALVARLTHVGIQDIRIVNVIEGSIKVTLKLPQSAALQLLNDPQISKSQLLNEFRLLKVEPDHLSVQYPISTATAILVRDPDNLTEKPRKLIGREDLQEEVTNLLDAHEPVLLQGLGGMGKTALAAAIAADWVKAGKGAALWLKAGSSSADALFEALADPFNARQAVASKTGEVKIQLMRQLLRSSEAKLLVLDDCWNGGALFTLLKAVPDDLPLLVTARQRYALDNMVDVGELKPDDALTLLLSHSKGEATHAARDLCKMLGYHAFAIEIAGRTLKARKLTPAELLTEIKAAPYDLKTPLDFNPRERSSVKDLLDASLEFLKNSPNEQDKVAHAVFLACGAFFAPQITAEMLALYLDSSNPVGTVRELPLQIPEPLQTALNTLHDHGLIERIRNGIDTLRPEREEQGVRVIAYRLHDLTYSYAHAHKQVTPQDVSKASTTCQQYIKANQKNLIALSIEMNNILGAAELASQSGDSVTLIDFMSSLAVGAGYFDLRGHTDNSFKLLNDAVAIARQSAKDARDNDQRRDMLLKLHFLLGKLGNAYSGFYGDNTEALKSYEEALSLAKELDEHQREAILELAVGMVHFYIDPKNTRSYESHNTAAERIAHDTHDEFALCFITQYRGYQAMMKKPRPAYLKGWRLSNQAAKKAEQLGAYSLHIPSLINRGECERHRKMLDAALATHQEAYRLAEVQEDSFHMSQALESIGEDYHALCQAAQSEQDAQDFQRKAQKAFDEAVQLAQQIGAKLQRDRVKTTMRNLDYQVPS